MYEVDKTDTREKKKGRHNVQENEKKKKNSLT